MDVHPTSDIENTGVIVAVIHICIISLIVVEGEK